MSEVKPTNKPPISLIPAEAIVEEAKAFNYGSGKHGRYAFRQGVEFTKLIDAALRHILAIADGEDVDAESGCYHAANARANLAMLLYMMKHKPQFDDRHTAENKPTFSQIADAWKNLSIKPPVEGESIATTSGPNHGAVTITSRPDSFILKNDADKPKESFPRFVRDRQNGFNTPSAKRNGDDQ